MAGELRHEERLSSTGTELLFLALTALFLAVFVWRVSAARFDLLAAVFLVLGAVFLFYSANYRTLVIRLDPESLALTFGVFTWRVPLGNVEDCRLDSVPLLMKYGGAGIHFMAIRGRYRASFNFLEYPRVVVVLKKKVGLVQDISFSTRRPHDLVRLVRESVDVREAA